VDAKLQRRIQRYGWDRAAHCYERFWASQIAPAQAVLVRLAALRPGERVLDIACGTGLVTWAAAEAVGPRGRVVGTDISDAMIAAARQETIRRGLSTVAFERSDAERLLLPPASVDVALDSLGLMYVADPLGAVREMARVLVPGGRAVAAVWGARSRCGWAEIFPIVDRRVRSEVCPLFFRLGTGDTLRATFEAAGLVDVTVERVSTVMTYASADEACGAAFAGGPVALAHSRFDDRTRSEAHAEYVASIEPYRRGSSYEIPGEFAIARGWTESCR
jgi:ubiquinone/menaquinone biosynthesis C-methylase UbiE